MLKALRNPPTSSLVCQQQRFLKKAARREIRYDYENEVKAWKGRVSVARTKAKNDYWNHQVQVENQFIETHKRERITKMNDDMIRWRSQICNISWMSHNKMIYLKERESKMLEKMQRFDIADNKRKLLNRYMLDAMTLESRRWPKMEDLDKSVSSQFLIPQTVLNYSEY